MSLGGASQSVVLAVVASASKLFMNAFSTLNIENGAVLQAALQRPAGQPLITVSNHVAVSSACERLGSNLMKFCCCTFAPVARVVP